MYRAKKTGTVLETGTITGREAPDGYDLGATDFLTEARIRRARPKERPYKLRDGGGLYLLITPTDAKQWRLRYAIGGREFKGTVDSIAGATGARFSLLPPENATGNYVKIVQRVPVKILLDPGQDPEHLLRPGLSATPTVYTR